MHVKRQVGFFFFFSHRYSLTRNLEAFVLCKIKHLLHAFRRRLRLCKTKATHSFSGHVSFYETEHLFSNKRSKWNKTWQEIILVKRERGQLPVIKPPQPHNYLFILKRKLRPIFLEVMYREEEINFQTRRIPKFFFYCFLSTGSHFLLLCTTNLSTDSPDKKQLWLALMRHVDYREHGFGCDSFSKASKRDIVKGYRHHKTGKRGISLDGEFGAC